MSCEKEVLKIGKKLHKLIESQKNDEALDVLGALLKMPMTFEILWKTRIGRTVNKLRKQTSDKNLAKKAKALLKDWMKIIENVQTAVKAEEEEDYHAEMQKHSLVGSKVNNTADEKLEMEKMKERGDRAIDFIKTIFDALGKNTQDNTTKEMKNAPEDKLLAVNAAEILQQIITENVDAAVKAKEEAHLAELQEHWLNFQFEQLEQEFELQLMNGKNPITRKIRAAAAIVVNWGAQEDPEFAHITNDNALRKLITFAEAISDINVETAGLENGHFSS